MVTYSYVVLYLNRCVNIGISLKKHCDQNGVVLSHRMLQYMMRDGIRLSGNQK